MAPKLPVSFTSIKTALCLSATTTKGAFSATAALPRPSLLLTRISRRSAFSAATDPVLESTIANTTATATTMGRSGYDKTNMRDAQNPRVAGTKKETKAAADLLTAQPHPVLGPKQTQSAKTTSASSQEQAMSAAPMAQSKAQERSDLPFTIHVPFECEGGQCVDAEDEIPVPSLVGRGWTFWS